MMSVMRSGQIVSMKRKGAALFSVEEIPNQKQTAMAARGMMQDTDDFLVASLLKILSVREIDVVRCLLYGNTAKKTAKELFISPRTVERHLENIKIKLNCKNKYELVKKIFDILNSED